MYKRTLLAVSLAAALLTAGCSSGGSEPTVATVKTTQGKKQPDPNQIIIGQVTGLGYSADGTSLYAATDNALLPHKREGWLTPLNRYDLTSLVTTEKTMYISGRDREQDNSPLGLLKSVNAGKKFEESSLAGVAALPTTTAASYRKGTLYTYSKEAQGDFKAGLYTSDDQGETWHPTEIIIQKSEIRALAVHPDHGNVLAIGTREGILFSEDSGNTVLVESPFFKNTTAMAFDLNNPDTLFVATQDEKGSYLYAFHNYRKLRSAPKSGFTYSPLVTLPPGNRITAVAVNPKVDEMAIATESGNIYQFPRTKPSMASAALTQQGTVQILKK